MSPTLKFNDHQKICSIHLTRKKENKGPPAAISSKIFSWMAYPHLIANATRTSGEDSLLSD